MKKNIYSTIILTTIIILIINIFIKSSSLTSIIIFSCNLFIKNLFPSLFPMFIISHILVEIDIPILLGTIFKTPMSKLFKTKGVSSFIFFMSMITGFPSSAKYIEELMDKDIINKNDAEKILTFTFFSNPLFIVNTIGNMFLNSTKIGLLILLSHILGNIIVGIIFRNFNSTKQEIKKEKIRLVLNNVNNKINKTSLNKLLFESIKSSLETLISIFGTVTFFLILINLTIKTPTNIFEIIISGITEMTTGLKYLSLANISTNIKTIISTFFISFGGLSVHFQIMSILNKKKVKYLPFLTARILHGTISSILIIIILGMDKLS